MLFKQGLEFQMVDLVFNAFLEFKFGQRKQLDFLA